MSGVDQIPVVLYHYTVREFAEECRDHSNAGRSFSAENWSYGEYGSGFYATDAGPADHSAEELREICFGDSRASHPMDGVLVIDTQVAYPHFQFMDGHIWLAPAEDNDDFMLDGCCVDIGIHGADGWQFDPIEVYDKT